jgi:hypothetical protein
MTEEVENIIKGITAKNLILDMIDAIENPVLELNMGTFVHTRIDGTYGACAACNYVIKKFGPHIIKEKGIDDRDIRSRLLGLDCEDLRKIEYSLNNLRSGLIEAYNKIKPEFFPSIKINENNLLPLNTKPSKEHLDEYRKLAEFQTK